MGWWGYGVMAGDTPLDIQSDMLDAAGVTQFNEKGELVSPSVVKKALENGGSEKIIEFASGSLPDYYPRSIVNQVAAHIHMSCGAHLPETIRTTVLNSDGSDANYGWRDPNARAAEIKRFQQAVVAYDGTPKDLSGPGLIEAFLKSQPSDSGTINTNTKTKPIK
jgi:hypothetical protein